MNGIIMGYGPDIGRSAGLEGAAMVDVAPTLLHCLGLPVSEDMDGRVLEGMLAAGFLAGNPPSYEAPLPMHGQDTGLYSEVEASEVPSRLAALGYVE